MKGYIQVRSPKEKENPLACNMCSMKNFKSIDELKQHKREKHETKNIDNTA